jgi:hypothetical protein
MRSMSEVDQFPSKSVHHLATTLEALGISYALVGGVAVALVARPRFTGDVDAVVLNVDDHGGCFPRAISLRRWAHG